MKIVYLRGKHRRTIYVATCYVAKTVALLWAMHYKVVAVK